MSEITCPSGMKLEIRGLKGKELVILQDKAAQKNGTFVDKILNACVTEIVDYGPYAQPEEGAAASVDWDKTLLGDKFFALLAVRSETFGPEYSFGVQCADCRKRFTWVLDLSALPVKTLSDSDATAVRNGVPIESKLPDGRVVKYRLPFGKDERDAAKSKTAENALVAMMAMRISELDGNKEKSQIRAYLEERPLSDLTKILKIFDQHDCGVETEIEVQCDDCEAVREVKLPLDRGFWLPT